jgi:ATP-dependent RNA helicase DeaD
LQNPELQKKVETYKGMLQVQGKNIVQDLQSKKATWESLEVPKDIQTGLAVLDYHKPSIIQAVSLPHIMGEPDKNFLFQAINGSGKTGAFGVPSLMKVDTSVDKIQVLIMANTRELIR